LERTRAAHIDVEAGVRRGDLNVERLVRAERVLQRPSGGDRARERGRQDRTSVDRDDVMGAISSEADLKYIVSAAPCMKDRAAPALSVCVDQFPDRRVETC